MIYNTIWWSFKGSSVGSCRGAFLGEVINGKGLDYDGSTALQRFNSCEFPPCVSWCWELQRYSPQVVGIFWFSLSISFHQKGALFFTSALMMWEKWSQMWQCRLKNPTKRTQVDLTFILWLILGLSCQFILFERPNRITCNIFILPFRWRLKSPFRCETVSCDILG